MSTETTQTTNAAHATNAAGDANAVVTRQQYDEIAGRLGSTLQQVESMRKQISDFTSKESLAEKAQLEKQGEYKTLLEKANAEIEAMKPKLVETEQLKSAFDAALKAAAVGIEDVADAIISNQSLTYEERMQKIQTLKEKLGKGGNGTSAGGASASGGKKTVTPEEFAKMSTLERAKMLREREGK